MSTRRVGAQLDAAPMSLYRHVADKDGLLVAMMDSVFGEAALPDPAPPGWRHQLRASSPGAGPMYQRLPVETEVLSFNRPRRTMRCHRGLTRRRRRARSWNHVVRGPHPVQLRRGAAVNLASDIEAEASTGLTDEEYLEVQAPALEAIVTAGHFPFVTTVFARLDADGFDLDATTLFEFGLHRLLDGLATMVGRRGDRSHCSAIRAL